MTKAPLYDPTIMPLPASHPCERTIAALSEEQRLLLIRPFGSPALDDKDAAVACDIALQHPNVLSVSRDPSFPYVLAFGQKVRLTLMRRYGVVEGAV